jgi:hypothetical protein
VEKQTLASTANCLPEIEAECRGGSISRIGGSNGAAPNDREPVGGAMNTDNSTSFDVRKAGEELRGFLKSETDCQAVATKALQDKAEALLKAGELLTEVAMHHKGHFDEVCRIAGLAKTRVYDLMKAAKGGLKALGAMQEGNRERQRKHREKKKALSKPAKPKANPEQVSVTPLTVTEAPPTQPVGNGLDPEVPAEARKAEYAAMEQEEGSAAVATLERSAAHQPIGPDVSDPVDEFRAACDHLLPRVPRCARLSCLEYAREIVERLAAAQEVAQAA